MSLRSLNYPPLVAAAGLSTLAGIPFLETLTSSASLSVLKGMNLASFALNVVAVSVPGRLDGQQDDAMRKGDMNPNTNSTQKEDDPLIKGIDVANYNLNRNRTLVAPSGWAFAIWGPIYIGEAAFVTSQMFTSDTMLISLNSILPNVTVQQQWHIEQILPSTTYSGQQQLCLILPPLRNTGQQFA